MANRKKVSLILLSVILALFVALPGIGIAVVKWGVLPPQKLTPLVLGLVNPMIEGEIDCERIELTFMETFPQIGLRITGGSVLPAALPDTLPEEKQALIPDTLLRFSEAVVSVNIRDYFQRNRITIDRLTLKNPYFYGYVDEKGKANWDILIGNEEQEPCEETGTEPLPVIDLQFIGIRNGHFIFHDRTADLFTQVAGFNLRMRNTLQKGNLNSDIKTGFESILFESPAYRLENHLSLKLETKLDLYRGKIAFSESLLRINDLPFRTEGQIEKAGDSLRLDIRFALKAENLEDLVSFVPDIYFQEKKRTEVKANLL